MSTIRVVGAFLQADGTWHAAISDGQQWRAKGTGAAFAKALADAQANYANGPTRERLWPQAPPGPVAHPLAYVDPASVCTINGGQWLQVLAWGEALGTLAAIETLEGRTGIPLATTGAMRMRHKGKWWISVVAVAAEPTTDFDPVTVTDAIFE